MADEYVLRSSILNAIHSGDIDMGMVTTHEYRLLKDLSERIDRRIQRVPAADVQPVRHGRWIMRGGKWRCSECDTKALLRLTDATGGCKEYEYYRANYCPNCGAKMYEEEDK